MKISAKVEYACIAILELALRHESAEPVRIREIAEAHGIPSQFLVQILLQLKSAGLVTSIRGAAGGYRLATTPEEITLGDVMLVMDGDPRPLSNLPDETATARVLMERWEEVAEAEAEILGKTNFAQLAAEAARESEPMYYI